MCDWFARLCDSLALCAAFDGVYVGEEVEGLLGSNCLFMFALEYFLQIGILSSKYKSNLFTIKILIVPKFLHNTVSYKDNR